MPVQVNTVIFVWWNAEQELLFFYQPRPPCPKGRNCKQFEEVLTSSSSFLSSPTHVLIPVCWQQEKPQGAQKGWPQKSAPLAFIIMVSWGLLTPAPDWMSARALLWFLMNWNMREHEADAQENCNTAPWLSPVMFRFPLKSKLWIPFKKKD